MREGLFELENNPTGFNRVPGLLHTVLPKHYLFSKKYSWDNTQVKGDLIFKPAKLSMGQLSHIFVGANRQRWMRAALLKAWQF